MNDWLGALITVLGVLLLLAVVTALEKMLGLSKETSRKLIHIGVGHSLFIAFVFIEEKWIAAAPLLLFVLLNLLSLRNQMFAVMETEERKSYGTVYYPLALLILTVLSYDNKLTLTISMLALAWGDGMAAVVGSKFGKHKYRIFGEPRSLEGSGAMLVFSFLTIGWALLTMGGASYSFAVINALGLAAVATILEALSYRDLDNLVVPLGVYGVCSLLL